MPDPSSNVTFSGTDSYLRAAMSGLAARQRAIANNVANVDTPNFKATEVRFEDALKSALSRNKPGRAVDQTALNAQLSRTSIVDTTSARADGNNVDIEREMVQLADNTLRYETLTQYVGGFFTGLKSVIKGQ